MILPSANNPVSTKTPSPNNPDIIQAKAPKNRCRRFLSWSITCRLLSFSPGTVRKRPNVSTFFRGRFRVFGKKLKKTEALRKSKGRRSRGAIGILSAFWGKVDLIYGKLLGVPLRQYEDHQEKERSKIIVQKS